MPLQKQNVNIVFAEGLETKTDSKLVSPPKLLDAKNCVQDKTGQLKKRNGRLAVDADQYLVGGQPPDRVDSLHSNGEQLMAIGTWNRRERIGVIDEVGAVTIPETIIEPAETVATRVGTLGAQDKRSPDFAHANIRSASTYTAADDDQAYRTIYDDRSAFVQEERMEVGANRARVVAAGQYLHFFCTGINNTFYVHIVDTAANTSPVWVGTAILTDVHSDYIYDVVTVNTNRIAVAYKESTLGQLKVVVYQSGTTTPTDTLTSALVPALISAAVFDETSTTYLSVMTWNSTSQVFQQEMWVENIWTQPVGSPFSLFGGFTSSNVVQITHAGDDPFNLSTSYTALYEYNQSGSSYIVYRGHRTGVAFGANRSGYGQALASKAFTRDETAYVWVFEEVENGLFLQKYDNGKLRPSLVTKLADGVLWDRAGYLPSVGIRDSNEYVTALLKTEAVEGTSTVEGVQEAAVTFGEEHLPEARIDGQALIGGSILYQFDGKRVQENGLHSSPRVTPPATYTTGGQLTDGTYFYKATYEWTDSLGQLHRSQSGPALEVTLSGGTSTQRVEAFLTPYLIGEASRIKNDSRSKMVTVHLYRTVNGGTIFYDTGLFGYFLTGYISIDDTTSDTEVQSNQILYDTSEVPLLSPAGCYCLTRHQRRILLVPNDDRTAIWYSHEKQKGLGVEFSNVLIKRVAGERITALLSIDDKVIVATESSLRYFVGDGADRLGANSQWSDAFDIQTDVGIESWKHVCEVPQGFVFHNSAGFHLLDRSLQVTHLTPPFDYRTGNVRLCIPEPARKRVRWVFDANNAIIWDYQHNQWYRETGAYETSAVVFQDEYYCAENTDVYSSVITKFDDSTYSDGSQTYNMEIDTGWIAVGGPTGFQRLYEIHVLGEWKSSHIMVVKVYYDYGSSSDTYQETFSSSTDPYLLRIKPSKQRCVAVRLEISESFSSGESCSLTGLRFIVGAKGKTQKFTSLIKA